jgi:hypothetical protein
MTRLIIGQRVTDGQNVCIVIDRGQARAERLHAF